MKLTTSRQARLATVRAEVTAWQARLATDLAELEPAGDLRCHQALADAAERHAAAAQVLAGAGSLGELLVARRLTIEGLGAVRFVRARQGLALGDDLADPGAPTVAELAAAPPERRRRGVAGSTAGQAPRWHRVAAIGATPTPAT